MRKKSQTCLVWSLFHARVIRRVLHDITHHHLRHGGDAAKGNDENRSAGGLHASLAPRAKRAHEKRDARKECEEEHEDDEVDNLNGKPLCDPLHSRALVGRARAPKVSDSADRDGAEKMRAGALYPRAKVHNTGWCHSAQPFDVVYQGIAAAGPIAAPAARGAYGLRAERVGVALLLLEACQTVCRRSTLGQVILQLGGGGTGRKHAGRIIHMLLSPCPPEEDSQADDLESS
mmetsp:Transcript_36893/g.71980  ORF Transcript_36893/g.71980 Transcript_36893/m.71980 type:complete len:232 (-) Transcript_36893:56-751(-)